MDVKKVILKSAPWVIGDAIISLRNRKFDGLRRSGCYGFYRDYYERLLYASAGIIADEQHKRFIKLENSLGLKLSELGKQSKAELKKYSLFSNAGKLHEMSTGGTTGASLKFHLSNEDLQERAAITDTYWNSVGYYNQKAIWFSGKNFVSPMDLISKRYYKNDISRNLRYYSTFHLSKLDMTAYIRSINDYAPEVLIGFPSTILDIMRYSDILNCPVNDSIKLILPTAETLNETFYSIIKQNLPSAKIFDQYSSSEGAPFIFQCERGIHHFWCSTGIIERGINPGVPIYNFSGEQGVVTSFFNRATPLLRYQINDIFEFTDKICECESNYPVVKRIEGRSLDVFISKFTGVVNQGNLSNSTKGVNGLYGFQIEQPAIDDRNVRVFVSCTESFDPKNQARFRAALSERIGAYQIQLDYSGLRQSSSGKYRLII